MLGVLPGLVGTIQATEAVKLILGLGESLAGRLLIIDALSMRFSTVRVPRDPACPACGTREITELIDYDEYCGTSADIVGDVAEVTPRELAQRLAAGDGIDLIDVREPYEWEIARLPGAHLIPLNELPGQMSSLDGAREIVVYCRTGRRSAEATRQLRAAGFRVSNLAGGILRWSDEVDPAIPKY